MKNVKSIYFFQALNGKTKKMKHLNTNLLKFSLIFIVLTTLLLHSLHAATITWDGSESSDWTDSANWDGNSVPGIEDDVIIPSNAPLFPIIASLVNIKSITIIEQANLEIVETGTLNINSSVENWKWKIGSNLPFLIK